MITPEMIREEFRMLAEGVERSKITEKMNLLERGTLTEEICEMLSIMAVSEIREIHEIMKLQTYKAAEIPEFGITRVARELPEWLKWREIEREADKEMMATGRDYVIEHTRFSKKASLNTNCSTFFEKMRKRWLKRQSKKDKYKFI